MALALALFPIIAPADESFFFEYTQVPQATEKRVEGGRLHVATSIRKIEAPKASYISASYSGLGVGREYLIQVDFPTRPGERWMPMVKLGDDIITQRIFTSGGEDGSSFSYSLEGSDPGKIEAWTRALGKLLSVPEDQIEMDLTRSEEDAADGPIPVPVPLPDPKRKPDAEPQAEGITAAEYTDKSQRTIRLKVNGADKDITAPEGKFWDELIVCTYKKIAFFVLNRGHKGSGWREDLHRFVADAPEAAGNPQRIPLKTGLKKASIVRLYAASDDGSRLFVNLHYMTKQVGDTTHYESYPYFLNPADGTVTRVKP